ncbi:MAG: ATPase, BadF/BadG/BcrA/BcrD type [Cypionkella sp.]|uniref:BadF/BadG/BcrA/BcrD ATPase family protein n=1 Tax=Cypionkella sp. TaxID=2811411 RepID=UPI002601F367|nr:BadF/BadG/BcrA/BcrD ATPase family protein [Cypionkella sp.]MDB5659091.1 ATPase, BadF/BadG/BcrA/BcrD type [Cypionkella sp.]
MQFFLGIDGGGTGCRAALADGNGQILTRAEAGPANIASDPDAALLNILAVAKDALRQAVGADAAKAELPRLRVAMGLAGANVAASVARLRAGLPFTSLRVETDAMTALKGALRDGDGIVAAVGTGSVFVRQLGGVVHRIGGRGWVLGDEGSGAWLGRALLSACLRAGDGLAELTPLLRSVRDELGGDEGIIAFGFTARAADFANFAKRIVNSDDPAALTLMTQAEADIAEYIALLQPKPAISVVFLGGIGNAIAPRFADRWNIRTALGSGVDGALWLARQDIAA